MKGFKLSSLKRILALALSLAAAVNLAACGSGGEMLESASSGFTTLSYDDAVKEVNAYYTQINPSTLEARLDTDMDFATTAALSDLSTFPVATTGRADIVIELAVATELSATEDPDNWANVLSDLTALSVNELGDVRIEARNLRDRLREYSLALVTCIGYYEIIRHDLQKDAKTLRELIFQQASSGAPASDLWHTSLATVETQLTGVELNLTSINQHLDGVKEAEKTASLVFCQQSTAAMSRLAAEVRRLGIKR